MAVMKTFTLAEIGGRVSVGVGAYVAPDALFSTKMDGVLDPITIGAGAVVRSGAVIYSGCQIGCRVQVGHQAVLRENTIIGDDSIFGTFSLSEGNARIGHHVMVQSRVIVQAGMVVEDYAFLGPGVITTNDKQIRWYRSGMRQELVSPVVEFGARVGAGAILLPGVRIGRNAFVGAGAVVTRDIPPNAVAIGTPAHVVGEVPEADRLT